MTVATELLSDAFLRIKEIVHETAADLTPAQLAFQPDPAANSIAWLVWHLTRVQDDHVSELADLPQAWTELGWRERFALPFGPGATGYGQNARQVASLDGIDAERLLGYHDDVHERTLAFLSGPGSHHLDRVVDASWNPPVTASVRIVSVISDDLQHAGQAAYVRGLMERAR